MAAMAAALSAVLASTTGRLGWRCWKSFRIRNPASHFIGFTVGGSSWIDQDVAFGQVIPLPAGASMVVNVALGNVNLQGRNGSSNINQLKQVLILMGDRFAPV